MELKCDSTSESHAEKSTSLVTLSELYQFSPQNEMNLRLHLVTRAEPSSTPDTRNEQVEHVFHMALLIIH